MSNQSMNVRNTLLAAGDKKAVTPLSLGATPVQLSLASLGSLSPALVTVDNAAGAVVLNKEAGASNGSVVAGMFKVLGVTNVTERVTFSLCNVSGVVTAAALASDDANLTLAASVVAVPAWTCHTYVLVPTNVTAGSEAATLALLVQA